MVSQKTRFDVFKRDDFTCQYCGRKSPEVILEVDHIVPVSRGGRDNFENLTTSCRECNRGKSDTEIVFSYASEENKIYSKLSELSLQSYILLQKINDQKQILDELYTQRKQIELDIIDECINLAELRYNNYPAYLAYLYQGHMEYVDEDPEQSKNGLLEVIDKHKDDKINLSHQHLIRFLIKTWWPGC